MAPWPPAPTRACAAVRLAGELEQDASAVPPWPSPGWLSTPHRCRPSRTLRRWVRCLPSGARRPATCGQQSSPHAPPFARADQDSAGPDDFAAGWLAVGHAVQVTAGVEPEHLVEPAAGEHLRALWSDVAGQ